MRTKLARCGLIELSGPARADKLTLGQHIDDYFARRSDVKTATQVSWSQSRRNLIVFFGVDKPLASVTAGDAKDYEIYLKTAAKKNAHVGTDKAEGLGPDTVRTRISHAKQFFGDALEHEVIGRNPFAKLKGSVIGNRDRDFFVTLEMVGKVLDACPDAQWRLMVALSRFGGCDPQANFLRYVSILRTGTRDGCGWIVPRRNAIKGEPIVSSRCSPNCGHTSKNAGTKPSLAKRTLSPAIGTQSRTFARSYSRLSGGLDCNRGPSCGTTCGPADRLN